MGNNNKLKNAWVVTASANDIAGLCSGASELAEKVTLVYAGEADNAAGAHKAYCVGELTAENRWVDYIPTIVELAKEEQPALVILGTDADCRLTAGHLAAALNSSAVSDIKSIALQDGGVEISRMVYGGSAVMELHTTGTAIVCAAPGLFEEQALSSVAAEALTKRSSDACVCIAVAVNEVSETNLPGAKKVVVVGRGVASEAELALAKQLADKLGAELGCTRPVAEELHLMPRETFIGISGLSIRPELYVAIGVSGQVHHMVGCTESGTVFAINKNPDALIFDQCDYGLVGDLNKVLPALVEAL